MKKSPVPVSTSVEVNELFKQTAWPEIFGRWAIIAQGSELPQKELFKQWEMQINGVEPMYVDNSGGFVSKNQRNLLAAMGLVQVRKVPIRDKIGFALFAPPEYDYHNDFANRVEFTESAIAMLTDPGITTPERPLLSAATKALPE